ncbi:hypothetical protein TNCV_3811871 [Trichonephila clavipes]|nr:hypothetical protein TNCV_3811871 [Trichonephila clavipes]
MTIEKHIVTSVTDGASMMIKSGKIRRCEYHLCYACTISNVLLYKKRGDLGESTEELENIFYENGSVEIEERIQEIDKAVDLEFKGGCRNIT